MLNKRRRREEDCREIIVVINNAGHPIGCIFKLGGCDIEGLFLIGLLARSVSAQSILTPPMRIRPSLVSRPQTSIAVKGGCDGEENN